jgi:hypothetical protein
MIEDQLVYLYCVTNQEPELTETEGLAGSLYLIRYRGLYAVAGKVKETEFGENGLKKNMADLEWIKANAATHERVIERVMADADVIPFKFATLFNTDQSLIAMLEGYGEEFDAILQRLGNKQEWGVKIYCDMDKAKTFSVAGEPEILEIENKISGSPPGKTFFLEKKKAELSAKAVNNRINEYCRESFDLLKDLSFEARINKLLPKQVTEREDDMVLNSAFLVGKDEVSDFISVLDMLKADYETRGFLIDCTGPWPPYNFCGLTNQKVASAPSA